jgi:hypothetical protein
VHSWAIDQLGEPHAFLWSGVHLGSSGRGFEMLPARLPADHSWYGDHMLSRQDAEVRSA